MPWLQSVLCCFLGQHWGCQDVIWGRTSDDTLEGSEILVREGTGELCRSWWWERRTTGKLCPLKKKVVESRNILQSSWVNVVAFSAKTSWLPFRVTNCVHICKPLIFHKLWRTNFWCAISQCTETKIFRSDSWVYLLLSQAPAKKCVVTCYCRKMCSYYDASVMKVWTVIRSQSCACVCSYCCNTRRPSPQTTTTLCTNCWRTWVMPPR